MWLQLQTEQLVCVALSAIIAASLGVAHGQPCNVKWHHQIILCRIPLF